MAGTKIKGKNLTKTILQFSYFPEDDYEVMVETQDKTKSYTITSKELKNHVLSLADYSAHYSIWGCFKFYDTVYDMVFTFDVEVEDHKKN